MVTPNAAMNAARVGSPGRISSVVPGALEIVGADLTAHYPGALILIDPQNRAEAINKQAVELTDVLNGAQHSYLIALIARTAEAKTAQTDLLVIGDSRASVTIELAVIPLV